MKSVEPWLDAFLPPLCDLERVDLQICAHHQLGRTEREKKMGKKNNNKQPNATIHMAEKEDGEIFAMFAMSWPGMNENACMEL